VFCVHRKIFLYILIILLHKISKLFEPRGSVVTGEAVEKIIKKDMIDPTNGKKMTEKDIIYIQRVFFLFIFKLPKIILLNFI